MKKRVVILGAGIAGLSAGYFLSRSDRYDVTILEQTNTIGGLCASFHYQDFTLDYGPHKIYSVLPGILDELVNLMGERVVRVPKKNKIFLNGSCLDYPLKLTNLLKVIGPFHFLKIIGGFALQKTQNLFSKRSAQSYEEFMIQTFGFPTYELIFQPLAEKVWGKPSGLHADMARIRVSALNTFHLILRLLKILPENPETSAKYFYYPRKGFGDLAAKLKEDIEKQGGRIINQSVVKNFERNADTITGIFADVKGESRHYPCDLVISSVPLTVLSKYVYPEEKDPEPLQSRHLILVYLFLKTPKVFEDQWIFFPERKFLFSRVSEQKQMSSEICPHDRTVLCCDFTSEGESRTWQTKDDALIDLCSNQLAEAKLINLADLQREDCFVVRKQNFYPRYDMNYLQTMSRISGQLKLVKNLLTTGRLGMFNYNNSDHCFDMGKFISQGLSEGRCPAEIWTGLERRVRDYKIID